MMELERHGGSCGCGCGGGCGSRREVPRRTDHEALVRDLEDRQRDLEQEAADVADAIRRLKNKESEPPA